MVSRIKLDNAGEHCELDQAIFISLMTSVMSYMVDEKIQKMAKW